MEWEVRGQNEAGLGQQMDGGAIRWVWEHSMGGR